LGDVLVVGVHSDEEITLNKGPPIMTSEERVKVIQSCKWVDEVCFGVPYSPSVSLLDSLNCDFAGIDCTTEHKLNSSKFMEMTCQPMLKESRRMKKLLKQEDVK
jgi:ethanolamine-phosphate cytidylyltransferase